MIKEVGCGLSVDTSEVGTDKVSFCGDYDCGSGVGPAEAPDNDGAFRELLAEGDATLVESPGVLIGPGDGGSEGAEGGEKDENFHITKLVEGVPKGARMRIQPMRSWRGFRWFRLP